MAPVYKVTYFDLTALGEPIRLLLTYGGLQFEDVRVTREQWPEFKPKMPMGQMPILEIDGKVYHQSLAISRYLAKKVGLAGSNDLEAMEIDIVVDTINDFRTKIGGAHYEENEKVKAEKFKVLESEVYPFYLKKLEEVASNNKGYFVNGKLTWADIFLVALLGYMNAMAKKDLLVGYPSLCKVRDNVMALPAIATWYKKTYNYTI